MMMMIVSDISFASLTEIPEDEARYWSNKLESINAMGMHDEVRHNTTWGYSMDL